MAALACMGSVLAVLLALAGNAATSDTHWPWAVDGLRQHAWPWVIVLGVLSAVAVALAVWLQEHAPAVQGDPPPPQLTPVPDWFVDRAQTRATVAAVCRGRSAVGITTSLWGAGGFGKTTLATAVCAHRRVRRRFRSRIYTVTIGRDIRGRAAVAAKVAEVTRFITGDTTEFDDPELAGAHLGRLLDQRPRTLLVLDDVWEDEQLTPFLHGGQRCVRLVTTRNPSLLPVSAQPIQVDEMSTDQARAVLTWELPDLPDTLVEALLRATGQWALLLRLTNRLIAEQAASGADPAACAEQILHRLTAHGPAAVDDPTAVWDLDNPRLRSKAVKASIEAATTLLPPGGADRFSELGVFAEDELIPVSIVTLLWQATGGLTEEQSRTLCRDLERLSLIVLAPRHGGRISLHDVVRDYLRNTLGPAGLTRINRLLIDAAAATLPTARQLAPATPDPGRAWWRLEHGYLLDHLIDHLVAAGRTASAEAVAGDLRWVEARLIQRGPSAPWSDLTRINSPHARPLARSLAQIAHLLTPTDPSHALTAILHSRLDHSPHWHPQIAARQRDPALRPCLVNRAPLPDRPHASLQRSFTGHTGPVSAVAVAPDGSWLATAGEVVRVWDPVSGTCTASLTGHTGPVSAVAVAPDGTWLASAGHDKVVRVWDPVSGTCTASLTGHTGPVSAVAVAPDGTWLASAGRDRVVRVWDPISGTCIASLTGHTDTVTALAIAPDGTWLASASDGRVVRIWDPISGTCTACLTGHTSSVQALAIASGGTWLASGGHDGVVRVWDPVSGTCTASLTGHIDWVLALAVAPDGTWLASAGHDGVVRVWDPVSGTCTASLTGHTDTVTALAIAPDGTWLASTGDDRVVRIWDPLSGTCIASLTGHTGSVWALAIAPDGTWLASAGFDQRARLWDRDTSAEPPPLPSIIGDARALAIASGGAWVASAGDDGVVRVWDPVSGICTASLTGHTIWVRALAIAPDGTWLASTGDDREVRIWDPVSGTCTASLTGHTDTVTALAIAPDGTRLATASDDEVVRVWDPVSGTCTASLTGHTGPVSAVAVAPDGTWLASAGRDRVVRVWDPISGTCT
ncbi:NB-ARC domain-containing protein, partial [Streptomyces olivochromogenes]|uniref:NB-ARC domain-containing protein n=1 Tax=Streptomyces olivochromogenes TaxID=1963 RepID=UPI001F1A3834